MRKRILILFISIFCILIAIPALASPIGKTTEINKNLNSFMDYYKEKVEKILDYNVRMEIQKDSSLIITEDILYDFGNQRRHGIYRAIPIRYKDNKGFNYLIKLKVLSVTDDQNRSYKYKLTNEYKLSGKYLKLRIGDPNIYVTGLKRYLIKYKVKRGVQYFDDHDELYWDAIGTEWTVPIEAGRANVVLPEEVKKDQIRTKCFVGYAGSTEEERCAINILDPKTIKFTGSKFGIGEGMTIVVGWPKGVVERSRQKEILWFFQDNWPIFLPIPIFIILFVNWWKRGRDPKGRGTIVPQYEPPDNLRPGEVGTIVDFSADLKDISATIIDLAVRGYLKIRETKPKKYEFIKLKEADKDLYQYEKDIFKNIFEKKQTKKLSDIKRRFYKHLETIYRHMYKLCVKKKYFLKNPKETKRIYYGLGILIIIGSIIISLITVSFYHFLSFLISGIMVMIFGFFMPRRTKKGAIVYENIIGFKRFLAMTEKERLKFHQAPEKKPEVFEKFLPYAMVLGVENQWAKQFKDIYKEKPDWYESYHLRLFTAAYFVSALKTFSSETSTSLTPGLSSLGSDWYVGSSGFGDGGSVGGGGGGGGGGSW